METVSISPADVPELVDNISAFLERLGAMGPEIAFWRAMSHSGQIVGFVDSLTRLCQHATYFQAPVTTLREHIPAFERLSTKIGALVSEVPFESRVNLLHRSLIPIYQQLYILHNLTSSILCRLRQRAAPAMELTLQPGSLLSVESRRDLRKQMRESVPSWDRKDWNLYDEL